MNLRPRKLLSQNSQRLLLALLLGLPLGGACSSNDGADAAPVDFSVAIVGLDGVAPSEPLTLRCDDTLAVEVAISSSDPKVTFTLRPANACGDSTRCGYVHVEALDADGAVLASVDSVTTEGVLRLPPEQLGELSQIRATLIRGLDQQVVTQQDGSEATDTVSPDVTLPNDCPETGGDAGAGGQGGATGEGGAGGQGGASAGAGAGGQGGAAGATNAGGEPSLGGAPAVGGAPAAAAGAPPSEAGTGGV